MREIPAGGGDVAIGAIRLHLIHQSLYRFAGVALPHQQRLSARGTVRGRRECLSQTFSAKTVGTTRSLVCVREGVQADWTSQQLG